jgi:hypothetical protein
MKQVAKASRLRTSARLRGVIEKPVFIGFGCCVSLHPRSGSISLLLLGSARLFRLAFPISCRNCKTAMHRHY